MSLETILPFLQPIAHLISDASVSEIMVNGNASIFVQREGQLEAVAATIEQKYLLNAVKRIARSLGEDFSEARPLLDSRLPDGSRVAAALPPCSAHGISLTIRKFRANWFTIPELVEAGAISSELAEQLVTAVQERQTILVCGATDTGKTTWTKALFDSIPHTERIAVIEDTLELKIDHPNVIRFEARRAQVDAEGNTTVPAVSIRDLVKATLRHRPDRLVIGEVRGPEAFDLIDALNTGHAGSISTVHANSALMGLSRLASLAMRAGVDVPYGAIQHDIGELINVVIYIERRDGKRRITDAMRIHGFDGKEYVTSSLIGDR